MPKNSDENKLPPEAIVALAAVAMHAYIASGKSWSAESIALQSFDVAEKLIEEGKKRGHIQK
jgi:hypothetical protein